jgi:hypothetical protein
MHSRNLFSRRLAHFERSIVCFAKIEELGLTPSDSFNFYASLRKERFAK